MVGALMLMKMEMGHLSVMEGTAHWAGSSYKKAVENDFLQSPQPTSFEKLSFRLPHQQENLIYSSIWCAHRGKNTRYTLVITSGYVTEQAVKNRQRAHGAAALD